MAALFLIFLLVAFGGAAAVGDDGATLRHLQLRDIPDSGPAHTSDALPQGLMDIMSMNGCGRFAGLLAAAPNASETFEHCMVAGGLTVICPDDDAVAAFEPKFNNLSTDDQLAVLLHHGVAARYGREHLATLQSMVVRTLASDTATNESLVLTVWSSSPPWSSGGAARVTKAISSGDSPVAVHVVDAVLLPSRLRQLLDGGDEAAACGGYLGWLYCTITVWQGLLLVVAAMVGAAAGLLLSDYHWNRTQNAVMH